MAKIFDLVDGKVVVKPESLLIYPFSEIWARDKSKEKLKAFKDITYIWFYSDFDSVFYEYEESNRHKTICQDVLLDEKYKPDTLVTKGIQAYTKFSTTPTMEMLEAQIKVIHKMKLYFEEIDFTEDDIDKVTKAIINVPKLMEAINQAKEICRKEQQTGERVVGNKTQSMFENGE